jgi:hypothetical protein
MEFCPCRPFGVLIGLWLAAIPAANAMAAEKGSVTRTIHDVKLIGASAAHSVSLNESVGEGMKLRTGKDSRAEVRFADGKVMRLGADATFGFSNEGTFNLEEGAVFLQIPNRAKGAKVFSHEIAAAVGGTTVVFEFHPTHYKFLVLEGTGRLFRPGHLGDSVLVEAGQMVFGQPNTALSDPVDFDIGRFVKTSRFITDFSPLGSNALMAGGSETQRREKSRKKLIDTNMVILGGGTAVTLVDPAQLEAIDGPRPAAGASVLSSPDLGKVEKLTRTAPSPKPTSSKTAKSNSKRL